MLFSQRKKLEEEYYQWLEKTGKEHGVKVEDCPLNVIAFLEIKGLISANNEKQDNNSGFVTLLEGFKVKIPLKKTRLFNKDTLRKFQKYMGYSIKYKDNEIGKVCGFACLEKNSLGLIVLITKDIVLFRNAFIVLNRDKFYIKDKIKTNAILDKSNTKV